MNKLHYKSVLIIILFPITLLSQSKSIDLAKNLGSNPAVGKYLNTRGIKLYYEIYGKGEPLLLIHGNGGSMKGFKYQINFFSKK